MRRFKLFGLVPLRWSLPALSMGLMFECRSFESTNLPESSTAGTSSVGGAGAAGRGGSGQDGGYGGDFEPDGDGGSHPESAGAGGADKGGGDAGSTGNGSEVGDAGNGSQGGTAGSAHGGGGPDGGVGSDVSEGGTGGATTEGVDEIIEPGCYEPGWHPAVSFKWTPDVSVWRGYNNALHVVAPQPTANLVAVRWQMTPSPDSAWDDWACFGVLPSPDRIAGARLSNGNFAVFASSTDGRLWSRFAFSAWGPWSPMTSAPGKGPISDLDFIVAAGEPNRVYAGRAGRLFARAATSAEPYASFGSWKQIAVLDAAAIAACPVGAMLDRVIVANTQGKLSTASIDIEAMTASEWSTLDPVEFDAAGAISCVRNKEEEPELFVSDSVGNVWRSTSPFEDWELAAETSGEIRSLDAVELPGDDPLLAAVDEYGTVRFWHNQIQGWNY